MFKKENFKIPFYLIIAVIASIGVSISIQSLLAAWIAPTAVPPSDNVAAPVNVGGGTQVKSGEFGVTNDFYVGGANTFFVDGLGTGNVGIGTAAPTASLDVVLTANKTSTVYSGIMSATNSGTGSIYGIYAQGISTHAIGTRPWVFGGYYEGKHQGAGAITNLEGIHAMTSGTAAGTGTVTNNTPLEIMGRLTYAGNTTTARGIYIGDFGAKTGALVNLYGLYINPQSSAPDNLYGIYIGEQMSGININNEIFVAGAGQLNFRDQNLYISSKAAGYLDFDANTAFRFNTGNVGIGTTNPNNLLQVSGLINFPNDKSGTFLGYQAGNVNTGNSNTFIGYQGGLKNIGGYDNTFIGYQSGFNNTNGNYNSAVGFSALFSNTTGSYNTATGVIALSQNTTGSFNSATGGFDTLSHNKTGNHNTAIGYRALLNTDSNQNTAIGSEAFSSNTSGNSNLAIGKSAGVYQFDGTTPLQTANNSIYIGFNSRGFNNSDDNSIVIGANAIGIGSNSVVLGNDSISKTALKGNVGIETTDPKTKLEVNGVIKTTPITSAPTCDANKMGGIYYNSTDNNFFGCRLNGAVFEWKQLNN